MEYKLIGNKVKKARKDKGITQEKFAEELGVSVSFISQVEAGDKKFNLSRISEVSQILEKPVGYFIDGFKEDESTNSDYEKINNILKNMSKKQLKLSLELIRAIEKIENEEE